MDADGIQRGLSGAEKAALKERASEIRADKKAGKTTTKATAAAKAHLEKIAEMPPKDRAIAERIHALAAEHAPALHTRAWYGMPAWTLDGKVVFFYTSAAKWGTRYATLGFDEAAQLDDGEMWATAFAIVSLTPDVEARIIELITRSVGAVGSETT